jgi:hypothetical protein
MRPEMVLTVNGRRVSTSHSQVLANAWDSAAMLSANTTALTLTSPANTASLDISANASQSGLDLGSAKAALDAIATTIVGTANGSLPVATPMQPADVQTPMTTTALLASVCNPVTALPNCTTWDAGTC